MITTKSEAERAAARQRVSTQNMRDEWHDKIEAEIRAATDGSVPLLACPFCGTSKWSQSDTAEVGPHLRLEQMAGPYWTVECFGCGVSTSCHHDTAREAVEAWATRKPAGLLPDHAENDQEEPVGLGWTWQRRESMGDSALLSPSGRLAASVAPGRGPTAEAMAEGYPATANQDRWASDGELHGWHWSTWDPDGIGGENGREPAEHQARWCADRAARTWYYESGWEPLPGKGSDFEGDEFMRQVAEIVLDEETRQLAARHPAEEEDRVLRKIILAELRWRAEFWGPA